MMKNTFVTFTRLSILLLLSSGGALFIHGFAPTTKTLLPRNMKLSTMIPSSATVLGSAVIDSNDVIDSTKESPLPLDVQIQIQRLKDEEEEEEEAVQSAADDFEYWFRFGDVARLYATDSDDQDEVDATMNRLQSATVAVVGLGGIGSWTAESLGRSGIGHIVLVDLDDLCISSTNRQLHALSSNIGVMKTQQIEQRLLDINPKMKISVINDFVMEENVEEIVSQLQNLKVQAVVDTIGSPEEKAALWMACHNQNIPVVACGNAAGRWDPTKVICNSDESPTGDAMLQKALDLLPQDHKKMTIPFVYAPTDREEQDTSSITFRTEGSSGSASFVSGTIGLVAASKIVQGIATKNL